MCSIIQDASKSGVCSALDCMIGFCWELDSNASVSHACRSMTRISMLTLPILFSTRDFAPAASRLIPGMGHARIKDVFIFMIVHTRLLATHGLL